MLDRLDRTIAAVASAPGPGGRGIIRVSGAEAGSIVARAVLLDDATAFEAATRPARYTGTVLIDARHDLKLPVSILYWPGARSYTGESMAELHLIGSPPLLDAVLSRLNECGALPAASGEFTLRAFLHRRIDLVQAEAVLGVIDASDQKLLEQALSQLGGGLSNQIAQVREQLLLDLADLEAGLDFVEEDIEFVQREAMQARLKAACEIVDRLRSQADARLQTPVRHRVLLAGLPNAGKSSLFNALIGGDHAIVSPIPGTTRDYLTAHIEWKGMSIELIDTAGWEPEATGPLAAGLAARDDQWRRSDLVVWCSACDQSPAEAQIDQQRFLDAVNSNRRVLRFWTKCDLAQPPARPGPRVSIHDSASIDAAREGLASHLVNAASGANEMLASTGARCRDCLSGAFRSLEQARDLAAYGSDDTLIALELRAALDELGVVTGQTYTDDILERIFSRFCIGK